MQACGEDRFAELPNSFVKRLLSIKRSLLMDNAAKDMQTPPAIYPAGSNSASQGSLNNSQSSKEIYLRGLTRQPPGDLPEPSLHHQPLGLDVNTLNMNIAQRHVLFVAKRGIDHKLSQICLDGLNNHMFFDRLKEEYLRLRGILRGRFSVWRFSHCDFYKVTSLI